MKRRRTAEPTYTKAILYRRCSTEEQADSKLGLEAQSEVCRAHCARMGWEILADHVDPGRHGYEEPEERPGLSAVIRDAKANPGAAVVVKSLDRLSRSQRITWALLDDRGEFALPLVSATENFDTTTALGRAVLGVVAVFAQLEVDKNSERTRDALRAVKARGKKLGALGMIERYEPVGLDKYGKQRYRRVIDPEKVKLVRLVQKRASGGDFLQDVADGLNADGIKSPTGKRWHKRTVRVAVGIKLPEAP